MDLQYQLKAGSYYLYDMKEAPSPFTGERRFRLKTDTVAIAFDRSTGERPVIRTTTATPETPSGSA